MGLFDKLRGELVDIIEWVDDSRHTLVWRFPRYHNQIKNGAQLIVRPGQAAVFVHRGQIADMFEPGHYTLKTDNLPILGTLQGWKHGFDSAFKAEVYFVSTRSVTDLKWGTPNPIMMRDDDFGPIRLRAFGTYTLKVIDPKLLLPELVGTDSEFNSDEVTELLRSIICQAFTDLLGQKKISALDLASRYRELADDLKKLTCERIDDEYGLDVPQLFIVNISLPEEVEKAIDTRTKMGVIGDMGKYQQYQMGTALGGMGGAGGGVASEGLGLGVGLAMAGRMMSGMPGAMPSPGMMPGMVGGPQQAMAPPPPPPAVQWHIAVNGATQGPFSHDQLIAGIRAGQVTTATMVWCAGQPAWAPAGQVPQLAGAFGPPVPPPPPPA